MREVSKAKATLTVANSLGFVQDRLVRQFKFPFQYEDDERMIAAYHDCILAWDHKHAMAAYEHHMNTGDAGLADWVSQVGDEKVIALLKALFKVDEDYPDVVWTGYRITETVRRGENPVYFLCLFARKRGSKTKVYSGSSRRAPNVL